MNKLLLLATLPILFVSCKDSEMAKLLDGVWDGYVGHRNEF